MNEDLLCNSNYKDSSLALRMTLTPTASYLARGIVNNETGKNQESCYNSFINHIARHLMKNPYDGLRKLAFQIRPEKIKAPLDNVHVYAAIVDMQIGQHMATLVCMIDGTTSLYFDTGGAILGLGQKHKAVADESLMFLTKSALVLDVLKPAGDFNLPPGNLHNVFLLAKSGIYKAQIDPGKYNSYDNKTKSLFMLYQRVLHAIKSSNELK